MGLLNQISMPMDAAQPPRRGLLADMQQGEESAAPAFSRDPGATHRPSLQSDMEKAAGESPSDTNLAPHATSSGATEGVGAGGGGMTRPDAAEELKAAIPVSHPAFADPMEQMANFKPHVEMPDMNTMPAHARTEDLRHQRDVARDPIGAAHGWKQKLLQVGLRAAPVALAGGLGGWGAAGAVAGGENAARDESLNRLTHDIDQSQAQEEKQYEGALRAKEIETQAQGNNLFRGALIQGRQNVANTNAAARENVAGMNNDTRRMIAGYDKAGKPIPEDQMSEVQQSAINLRKAQTDLANARKTMLPDQLKLANQRYQLALKNYELHAESVGINRDRYEAEFFGTHEGTDIPGMPQINGQTVGPRAYTSTGPNPTDRTTIKQSKSIDQATTELTSIIDAHRDFFGPGSGRGQMFEHWLGSTDPEANRARGLIESYFSMHPYMHKFRSMGAVKGFKQAVGGFEQNADAMIAGIQGLSRGAEILGQNAAKPISATDQGVNPFKRNRGGAADFGAAPAGKPDGATGKIDGKPFVVKGGRMVPR
jgi:hypothetical protein